MAAILPSERPYLKTGVFTHAKNRIVWLLVLMISGMITGTILGKYEAAFAALPILVTFIPMLTDTGGNAGSQSSTLIIRGMALSEITPKDIWRIIWKELQISFLVGLVLCIITYIRVVITNPEYSMVALTISLCCNCDHGQDCRFVLPIIAKKLKVTLQ